jgi:hypothetical protein
LGCLSSFEIWNPVGWGVQYCVRISDEKSHTKNTSALKLHSMGNFLVSANIWILLFRNRKNRASFCIKKESSSEKDTK